MAKKEAIKGTIIQKIEECKKSGYFFGVRAGILHSDDENLFGYEHQSDEKKESALNEVLSDIAGVMNSNVRLIPEIIKNYSQGVFDAQETIENYNRKYDALGGIRYCHTKKCEACGMKVNAPCFEYLGKGIKMHHPKY